MMRNEDSTRRTGRTTRILEEAIDIASYGSFDKTPSRWRYVWAYFLACISLGFFKYQKYLDKYTVRRHWEVFFIIATSQYLSYVQEITMELLDKKQLKGLFQDGGRVVSFDYGTLHLIPFQYVPEQMLGVQNFYPIFDHYTTECYAEHGTSKQKDQYQEITTRGIISLNTATVNSQN